MSFKMLTLAPLCFAIKVAESEPPHMLFDMNKDLPNECRSLGIPTTLNDGQQVQIHDAKCIAAMKQMLEKATCSDVVDEELGASSMVEVAMITAPEQFAQNSKFHGAIAIFVGVGALIFATPLQAVGVAVCVFGGLASNDTR